MSRQLWVIWALRVGGSNPSLPTGLSEPRDWQAATDFHYDQGGGFFPPFRPGERITFTDDAGNVVGEGVVSRVECKRVSEAPEDAAIIGSPAPSDFAWFGWIEKGEKA